MSYKPYQKYKPVDIRWIDEIPEHWNNYKMKYTVDTKKYYQIGDGDHGSIKPEMYSVDSGIPYIRVQNLSWDGELVWEGMVYISTEIHRANPKSKIIPNDILIAKTGATVGKLALIPDSVIEANTTSSVGKVTLDQERFYPKFVLYAFMSKYFQDQIWIEASQKSAQPGFNIDDLIFFVLFSPIDIAEQKAIANFLDEKTAQIDKLISNKQKLIDLLKEERTAIINQAVTKGIDPNVKLKTSGIDWLGEIPEHWEVFPIKYIVFNKVTDGPHETPEFQTEGIPFVSAESVKNGRIDLEFKRGFISKEQDLIFSKKVKPRKEDIFIVKSGSTTGKICIVDFEDDFNIWSPLALIRPDKNKALSWFVYYALQSFYFQDQIQFSWSFGTQPNIGMNVIENLKVLLPINVKEQNLIVHQIETEINRIDNTIIKIEKELELLQEYRTALISEVVTGKIKVV